MKRYEGRILTQHEATDAISDAGLILSDKDADGHAIQGTARLHTIDNLDGTFDVRMPIEHLGTLFSRGFDKGTEVGFARGMAEAPSPHLR